MLCKLAWGNVRRAGKDYLVYLLTLTLAVTVFYAFNTISGQSNFLSESTNAILNMLSGVMMWRAWLNLPVGWVRFASILHAAAAVWMVGLIIMHVYAAIWTKGTIRAMWYGTVTRPWAKQHHRAWYRQMTGK